MRKKAFDPALAGMLLGGAAGVGLGVNWKEDPLQYGAVGGLLGAKTGWLAEKVARWFRARRLMKHMSTIKDVNKKDMAKLIKAFGGRIPVYVQSSGKDIENALYSEGGNPWRYFSGPDVPQFKDALTGKPVKNHADKAVYLGSSFKKLPVLAHELGHADDFAQKSPAERGLATALAIGTAVGAGSSLALLFAGMGNPDLQRKMLPLQLGSAFTATAGIIGQGLLSKRNERRASDRAMQVLKRLQKGKSLDSSREALEKTYATYEPIQFGTPAFGSGEYFPQEKAAKLA